MLYTHTKGVCTYIEMCIRRCVHVFIYVCLYTHMYMFICTGILMCRRSWRCITSVRLLNSLHASEEDYEAETGLPQEMPHHDCASKQAVQNIGGTSKAGCLLGGFGGVKFWAPEL